MDSNQAIKSLGGLRTAIGVGAWLTPRVAGKMFGLDVSGNPQAPYLARLFGVRDIALAWGILSTSGEARRNWLLAGAACDAADAAAGVAGLRGGYLPAVTSVLVTTTALGALGLGVVALTGSEE